MDCGFWEGSMEESLKAGEGYETYGKMESSETQTLWVKVKLVQKQ